MLAKYKIKRREENILFDNLILFPICCDCAQITSLGNQHFSRRLFFYFIISYVPNTLQLKFLIKLQHMHMHKAYSFDITLARRQHTIGMFEKEGKKLLVLSSHITNITFAICLCTSSR